MELSIDTSTRYASVCLADQANVLCQYSWFSQQNHSKELLPNIVNILDSTGLSKGDLDCIIVAAGPGSFSALRVGLSTAKGLCTSLGVPLISVNTMEIEAHKFQGLGFPICSVLDIGRGEIAASIYSDADQKWRCIIKEDIYTPAQLCSTITMQTIFCGEGIKNVADSIKDELGALAIIPEQNTPTRLPASIAAIGYKIFSTGVLGNVSTVEPIYLRRPSISKPRLH